ncbi:MAG: redoxin domain-containing protein [Marinifilum sp.]|jgi:peroxiredoxin|nr:redoxin domain-containing protein [Marinifilum sp.]
MVKIQTILSLLFCLGLVSCQEKVTIESILKEAIESTNKIETISGELSFNFGSPSPESDMSMTKYKGSFSLKKVKSDSLAGWYLISNMEDLLNDISYQAFYSGESLIYFMNQDSTIQKEPGQDTKFTFSYSTINNELMGSLTVYLDKLTSPDSVFNQKNDSWLIGNVTLLRDTMIDDLDCYLIQNEKQGTTLKFNATYSNKEIIAIDKETHFPVYLKTHFQRAVDGKSQIDQICSYQIRELVINRPIDNKTFKFNQTIGKKKKSIPEKNELKSGDYIPSLKVLKLNGDSISLHSLKGQVSILEFGYIGCGNCTLASNELKKSYHLFKGKTNVKFYYFNTIDKPHRIREFVKKENIPFETIIGNEIVENSFGLSYYPRIFIVNKDLKITKVFNGYSGVNMGNEINEEIKKIMK